ncbi:hypothetical protein ACFX58_02065 [Sphingomonas sp. NCPPB 2930]
MGQQAAVRRRIGIERERDVVGVQPVRPVHHQRGEWVVVQRAVQRVGIVLFEVGRQVHGGLQGAAKKKQPQPAWHAGTQLLFL